MANEIGCRWFRCSTCKRVLPRFAFAKRTRDRGVQYQCRTCNRNYQQSHRWYSSTLNVDAMMKHLHDAPQFNFVDDWDMSDMHADGFTMPSAWDLKYACQYNVPIIQPPKGRVTDDEEREWLRQEQAAEEARRRDRGLY